jgi:aspartyl protease family protein
MATGMHGVLREAFTWVIVAGGMAYAVMNFDDIRALNSKLLGLPPAETASEPATSATSAFGKLFAKATEQQRPKAQRAPSGMSVEIASDNRGHYEASAEINGRDVSALVDTGASMVVLTYEDAERAGIYVKPSDFTMGSRTANGTARNAPVTLDQVCIESVCVRDVRAMVAEPGRLHVSLLGMTYLSRLARFEIRSGTLVLEE